MKNKYYNIFFTSEKDGQGRNFRLTGYSLYLGALLCVVVLVFSYIGFSYVIGQDKLAQELKDLRKYKEVTKPLLENQGVKKEIAASNNLENIVIDYMLANNLDYPEDAPVEGVVTQGILEVNGDIVYSGIDIASESKENVKSPLSGKVEYAGWSEELGNYVVLKHVNNFITVYGYLHSALVKPEENINKGQIIAQVGSDNSNNNPHLYFEIRNGNVVIDPRKLIIDYKENDVSIR